ncbi:hypothetical protein ACI79J_12710 [Geodermatophilus sp. SYSU D01062]
MGMRWRNPEKEQLRAELKHLEAMYQAIAEECDDPPGLKSVDPYLDFIQKNWRRDIFSAWQHAYYALEEMAKHVPDHRLVQWSHSLHAELSNKGGVAHSTSLTIEGLLKTVLPESAQQGGSTPRLTKQQREAYYEALRLRNRAVMDRYWRLDILRHHQVLLAAIGIPVLIVTSIILALYAPDLSAPGQDAVWKGGPIPCLLAMLLGVLGATVSAAQRATTTPPHAIIERFGSYFASVSRIPIGAVAGLTVWLFSVSSVYEIGSLDVPNLLLAAFAAGFAERLIVQGSSSSVLGGGDATQGSGSSLLRGGDSAQGKRGSDGDRG